MAKYKYTGSGNRVFPSLGLTVKSGEEFEAPDNFIAVGVEKVAAHTKKTEPKVEIKEEELTESAPSDEIAGE